MADELYPICDVFMGSPYPPNAHLDEFFNVQEFANASIYQQLNESTEDESLSLWDYNSVPSSPLLEDLPSPEANFIEFQQMARFIFPMKTDSIPYSPQKESEIDLFYPTEIKQENKMVGLTRQDTVYGFANGEAKEILRQTVQRTIKENEVSSLYLRNYDLLDSILEGTAGTPCITETKEETETLSLFYHKDPKQKSCLNRVQITFLAVINLPHQNALPQDVYKFMRSHFTYYSNLGDTFHGSVRNTLVKRNYFKADESRRYSVKDKEVYYRLQKNIKQIVEIKGVNALKLINKDIYKDIINGTAGSIY